MNLVYPYLIFIFPMKRQRFCSRTRMNGIMVQTTNNKEKKWQRILRKHFIRYSVSQARTFPVKTISNFILKSQQIFSHFSHFTTTTSSQIFPFLIFSDLFFFFFFFCACGNSFSYFLSLPSIPIFFLYTQKEKKKKTFFFFFITKRDRDFKSINPWPKAPSSLNIPSVLSLSLCILLLLFLCLGLCNFGGYGGTESFVIWVCEIIMFHCLFGGYID